jgi:hypothetical protein
MGTPVVLNSDFSLMEPHDCKLAGNIRVTRIDAKEAAGPVYARALGNKLVDFKKDDFCLVGFCQLLFQG